MSQMKELSSYLDELRKAGKSIVENATNLMEAGQAVLNIADSLNTLFGKKEETPTEEKAIEFTDVRAKLAEKSREGHTDEVKALLKKYGADRLSDIKPDDYAALMSEVEVL
ncbi:MAG: hypothetical protein ACOYJU_00975 [Anaerovoracaceae bacterium]|jgi:hypothetical protein